MLRNALELHNKIIKEQLEQQKLGLEIRSDKLPLINDFKRRLGMLDLQEKYTTVLEEVVFKHALAVSTLAYNLTYNLDKINSSK